MPGRRRRRGIRTPLPVSEMPKWNKAIHSELMKIKDKLESHYKDVQDIEFTIEKGKLYMLQTRNGKRDWSCCCEDRLRHDQGKMISEETGIKRIPAADLIQLLLPSFDPAAKKKADVLTIGLPASPGGAVGKLAFTAEEAVERTHAGEAVLLVRKETNPERHRRHEQCRWYLDQHRWHDQPRCGRRPWLGSLLRCWCW